MKLLQKLPYSHTLPLQTDIKPPLPPRPQVQGAKVQSQKIMNSGIPPIGKQGKKLTPFIFEFSSSGNNEITDQNIGKKNKGMEKGWKQGGFSQSFQNTKNMVTGIPERTQQISSCSVVEINSFPTTGSLFGKEWDGINGQKPTPVNTGNVQVKKTEEEELDEFSEFQDSSSTPSSNSNTTWTGSFQSNLPPTNLQPKEIIEIQPTMTKEERKKKDEMDFINTSLAGLKMDYEPLSKRKVSLATESQKKQIQSLSSGESIQAGNPPGPNLDKKSRFDLINEAFEEITNETLPEEPTTEIITQTISNSNPNSEIDFPPIKIKKIEETQKVKAEEEDEDDFGEFVSNEIHTEDVPARITNSFKAIPPVQKEEQKLPTPDSSFGSFNVQPWGFKQEEPKGVEKGRKWTNHIWETNSTNRDSHADDPEIMTVEETYTERNIEPDQGKIFEEIESGEQLAPSTARIGSDKDDDEFDDFVEAKCETPEKKENIVPLTAANLEERKPSQRLEDQLVAEEKSEIDDLDKSGINIPHSEGDSNSVNKNEIMQSESSLDITFEEQPNDKQNSTQRSQNKETNEESQKNLNEDTLLDDFMKDYGRTKKEKPFNQPMPRKQSSTERRETILTEEAKELENVFKDDFEYLAKILDREKIELISSDINLMTELQKELFYKNQFEGCSRCDEHLKYLSKINDLNEKKAEASKREDYEDAMKYRDIIIQTKNYLLPNEMIKELLNKDRRLQVGDFFQMVLNTKCYEMGEYLQNKYQNDFKEFSVFDKFDKYVQLKYNFTKETSIYLKSTQVGMGTAKERFEYLLEKIEQDISVTHHVLEQLSSNEEIDQEELIEGLKTEEKFISFVASLKEVGKIANNLEYMLQILHKAQNKYILDFEAYLDQIHNIIELRDNLFNVLSSKFGFALQDLEEQKGLGDDGNSVPQFLQNIDIYKEDVKYYLGDLGELESDDEVGKLIEETQCGICLCFMNEEEKILYKGKHFHRMCINYWLNRVQKNLSI